MAKVKIEHAQNLLAKYYRQDHLPTVWCPGCGIGTIVSAMVRAIDNLGLNQDDIVIATGIGCSGLIYNYLNFDGYHGIHGRAIAVAIGLKLSNPRLKVIVPMGDGDCVAIGGNHFIHAARRNIDITAIVSNNSVYGMTGGQVAPLTPPGAITSSTPYGNVERAFDFCELAKGAGATYVARGTVYHTHQLINLIANGIKHQGFSFIEVISQCPVQYGRRNNLRSAAEMLMWQRQHAVSMQRASMMSPSELEGKFVTGELLRIDAPDEEYTALYQKVIEKAQGGRQ